MKKLLIFIILLFVVFMFGCSDKNTEKDNNKENNNKIKLEYKEYKSSQSFFKDKVIKSYFYVAKTNEEYQDLNIESIHLLNSDYFNTKGIVCFEIAESSGGNVHSLDIYLDNNVISIDYKLTNNGVTCDMAYYIVILEVQLDKIDNIEKVEITGDREIKLIKYSKLGKMLKIENDFEDGILHGKVNGSYGLTYIALPFEYTQGKIKNAKVNWSSSDEDVALVNNIGHVRFLGAGTCEIKASRDGYFDTIQVIVEDNNELEKYELYRNLLLRDNMKGLELYCYRREYSSKYDCVLMGGTNRFKTVDEIKELQDNLACPLDIMKDLITIYASKENKRNMSITIVSNPPTDDEIQHVTKLYENELEALYVYLGLREKSKNWVLNQFDLSGEKHTFNGDVNLDFTDDCIMLTMMHTESYPILEASDFGIDNIIRVDYIAERPNDYMYKQGTAYKYTQILAIYVKPRGKEKILEYIKELEKLEFVGSASPNMIMSFD